jgi:coproporphyrinogen III oxidase-like Fe-S oxidoreductase
MIRVFELHHNLQNIENVVASLLGIGSLGIGEALELPCTLQTSGEFWNFVPLVHN